ncbi:S8 family peptidase [Actinomadura welshii]
MSGAGRRRPARARLGARTTAALAVLALGAAFVAPAAIAGDAGAARAQPVRGAAAGMRAHAPTDQIRGREWHLEALRAPKAWKYAKGRGVTVAVLDTGVDKSHPDLTGQVITGPDLTGGLRAPGSRYWGLHGTSMASIIAGHGHGPGLSQGMMGIAPQSNILSIRVTLENDDPLRRDNGQPTGSADRDAVAQGIRYAVDHGAQIINMSLGGGRQFYNGTKAQESAIKYALGKGVVLIASAGNDGSGANRKNFPAAYPGVIAVGALDRRLRLWKDSNRRSHAAVCAPGVDIVSADASNGYVVGTGTSASSAMVAGVAALVRSRYPKLTPEEVRRALIQGSPARRGQPTGSPDCRGTVDALRTLYAAHRINKTSSGPVETPPPSPAQEPVADSPVEDAGVLLPVVLVGGGLLVVLGLVLGWRQRRRPEDDTDDTDAVPDYGLPAAEPAPRPPVSAAAAAPGTAQVNAPLWQSTDVYQGPPAPPVPPMDGTGGGARLSGADPWSDSLQEGAGLSDIRADHPDPWSDLPQESGQLGDAPLNGARSDDVLLWSDPSREGAGPGDGSLSERRADGAQADDAVLWGELSPEGAGPGDGSLSERRAGDAQVSDAALWGDSSPEGAGLTGVGGFEDGLQAGDVPLSGERALWDDPSADDATSDDATSDGFRGETMWWNRPSSDVPDEAGPWDGSPLDTAPLDTSGFLPPPHMGHDRPVMSHELRPFDPGEFSGRGRNGQANGHRPPNGNGAGNGHAGGLNGTGGASRNGAGGGGSPSPAVPPEPPAGAPPSVAPLDERPTGPLPPAPPPADRPDDEAPGRYSRRSQPPDDEDYRPPWW